MRAGGVHFMSASVWRVVLWEVSPPSLRVRPHPFLRTHPCATAAKMPCIASGTPCKAATADGQSMSQPARTQAEAMVWGKAVDPSSPTPAGSVRG